ncbi:hypothetical protein B296_00032829, partial [Ensete ventricosum]
MSWLRSQHSLISPMCVSLSVSVRKGLGSSGEVGWACYGEHLGWAYLGVRLGLLLLGICRGILHKGLV